MFLKDKIFPFNLSKIKLIKNSFDNIVDIWCGKGNRQASIKY